MQERLDIYNEAWQRIGTAPRDEVHEKGLLHRVVHCWILENQQPVFWFQQRAHTKKDFPDYFDLACGGHVDAGETPQQAMLRELGEEIGLHVTEKDLIPLGAYRAPDFRMPGYYDREMSYVFMIRVDEPAFELGDEVQRMVRVRAENFYQMEVNGRETIPIEMENAKHIFSHVEWHMTGYEIIVDELEKTCRTDMIFADKKEVMGKYPIPTAFSAYTQYALSIMEN